MTFLLSPGHTNESIYWAQLLEQGVVKPPDRSRLRLRPWRLLGEKGCTGLCIRNYLHRCGICLTISYLSHEPIRSLFSCQIYPQRNIVERTINRLKQFRRITTRYEKFATNYTDTIMFACIVLWL